MYGNKAEGRLVLYNLLRIKAIKRVFQGSFKDASSFVILFLHGNHLPKQKEGLFVWYYALPGKPNILTNQKPIKMRKSLT